MKKEEEEEGFKIEDVKMEVEEAEIKEKEEKEEGYIKEEEMELEEGEILEEMDLDAEAFIKIKDDTVPPSQFYHPNYGFYRPMCSEETLDMMEGKETQPAWPEAFPWLCVS
ncbi:hypothetical protein BO82DRAFT_369027 [Aspergillus uvarum CBS 121591]|uniref:Uncharacterized protein n=1 Tax=Aspergillus uvarum CBS 121591 TaxID=1448315 RepID=A0A319BT76_9EURO|nr:hypothetical protein BO82DRAFT_369027 [Aspergillus uvarum CBS 121591]PYH76816.1 hypothetical protein BO82DRAFT_369027 [Aspergillus uvarum CBS 121591]